MALNMLVCRLGPGTTNLVYSTLSGLILAQLTTLARAEAANGLKLNFS